MKKKIVSFLLCLLMLLSFAACNKSEEGDTTDVSGKFDLDITEKMFVSQTNDVWNNLSSYIGKTVTYEGMFFGYAGKSAGTVIRYGPGCCGTDQNCGFDVVWDSGVVTEKPADNEWVKIEGNFETYTSNGVTCPRVRLTSLTVMQERGSENVTN